MEHFTAFVSYNWAERYLWRTHRRCNSRKVSTMQLHSLNNIYSCSIYTSLYIHMRTANLFTFDCIIQFEMDTSNIQVYLFPILYIAGSDKYCGCATLNFAYTRLADQTVQHCIIFQAYAFPTGRLSHHTQYINASFQCTS